MSDSNPDILALRYASPFMRTLWSPETAVQMEREIWATALEVKNELGLKIPDGAIQAYRDCLNNINLDSIAAIEAEMQHDVVARKTEFDNLATAIFGSPLSLAHEDFTSRDDTENCEQLRIFSSLGYLRDKGAAVLFRLDEHAQPHANLDVCGRSHRQPGQVTTHGKRIANMAVEMLRAMRTLEHLISNYAFRGFKGAMGTRQDLITRFGNRELALEFERRMGERLGMQATLKSTGQIYPRSMDFEVMSVLFQLSATPGNLSRLIRDSAELRHMNEGFSKGRKASSAMAHKKNPSKSERIKSLRTRLKAEVVASMDLAGEQEYEGDVSCSVNRRVMLANAFCALDGIFETTLTILDQMQLHPKVIAAELKAELPFLSTTAFRTAMREKGMDDTKAYKAIQRHALAASNDIVNGKPNSLIRRLGRDKSVPLSQTALNRLCVINHGDADDQVLDVAMEVKAFLATYDEDVLQYKPATRN